MAFSSNRRRKCNAIPDRRIRAALSQPGMPHTLGGRITGTALRAFGLMIAFAVCLALILPGFADENDGGTDAHVHTDDCYIELVCDIEEGHEHSFTSGCFSEPELLCGLEFEEHIHSNDAGCFSAPDIICENEDEEHIHSIDAGCFSEPLLLCGIEFDEHIHSFEAGCFSEPELLCAAVEGHVHSIEAGCYIIYDEPVCGAGSHNGDADGGDDFDPDPDFETFGGMLMALDGVLSTSDQWDLNNFTTGIAIRDGSGAAIAPGDSVVIGSNYTLSISFKEKSNMQFQYHTDGYLHYQLPANITIDTALSDQPIFGVGTPKPVIGRYSVTTDGHLTVVFDNVWENGTAAPGNFIAVYTNAQFTIDILASYGGSGGNQGFDFGNGVLYNWNLSEPVGVPKIEKSASAFDPAGNTIDYSVTVTAEGGDLIIDRFSDFIGVGGVNLGSDMIAVSAVNVDGDTAAFSWRGGSSPPIWDVLFSPAVPLAKGESMTVTYTVDFSEYIAATFGGSDAVYGNYEFTVRNTAGAGYTNPDDNTPRELTVSKDVTVTHSIISKTGVYSSSNNRIAWTVNVGDGLVPLGGYTITDTHGPGVTMPETVTLTLRDRSNAAITPDITVTASESGFTYEIPVAHGSPARDVYYVTASYNTNIDTVNVPLNGQIVNDITVDLPGGPGARATAGVGVVGMSAYKYAGWYDEENILWTVIYNIPAGLQGRRVYLSDYMGDGVSDGDYSFTNRPQIQSVTLNGVSYAEGEGPLGWRYAVNSSSSSMFSIYFNNATGSTNSRWQFSEATQLIITYKSPLSTLYSDPQHPTLGDWLKSSPRNIVSNQISFYLDGTNVIAPYAQTLWPVFKKNTASTVSGNDMLFRYEVMLNGSGAWHDFGQNPGPDLSGTWVHQTFDAGGPAIFFDEFDERLEYEPGSFIVETHNYNGSSAGYSTTVIGIYKYPDGEGPDISGNTLTVDLADLVFSSGTNDGADWYVTNQANNRVLVVRYYMRLKDAADLNDEIVLRNTAGIIGSGSKLYEAVSGRFTDDCTITYGRKAVEKSMSANGNVATFSIIVNPEGKKFVTADGANLLVTDRMSDALSFYLTSISVLTETVSGSGVFDDDSHTMTQTPSTEPGALWTWALSGENEITLVLPDETALKIVYDALIRGDADDDARIENYVQVTGGYHDEYIEEYRILDTDASGTGSRSTLLLYKTDSMNHSKFLQGARFALYVGWPTSLDWNYGTGSAEPVPGEYVAPGGGIPQSFTIGAMTFYYLDDQTTAGANGSILFDDPWITPSHEEEGAVYAVVEITAPSGYEPPAPLASGTGSVTLFSYTPRGAVDGKAVVPVTDNIMITNTSLMTDISITVEKTIAGTPSSLEMPTFTFNLLQVTDGSGLYPVFPMVDETGYITGEGTYSFTVSDLHVGSYYFLITESPNPVPGNYWEYDDAAHIVKVTVFVGTDGYLDYEITEADRTVVEAVVFENTYDPPPPPFTVILPHTGGPGTSLFLIGGAMMMLGALAVLGILRKGKAPS